MIRPHAVEDAWLHLLADGYRVFDISIATLQHVLDGTVTEVVGRLIELGPPGMEAFAETLRARLDQEHREIQQLENLESIEGERPGKMISNSLPRHGFVQRQEPLQA
jgi:hypothetical protein